MERKGKTLKVLQDGHPRRLADGRNAWRKMTDAQRGEFIAFIFDNAEGNPFMLEFHHEGRRYDLESSCS